MVIVSDYLQHNKLSVNCFMEWIFGHLTSKFIGIKSITIFSDGAASQFKQKYLFANLYLWENQFDIKLTWNFFATSHGKGAVDGIGGTVKRSVWRHIKAGHQLVTTASEYADVAKARNPNIQIQFISNSEVEAREPELLKRWEGVLSIPKTQKLHYTFSQLARTNSLWLKHQLAR